MELIKALEYFMVHDPGVNLTNFFSPQMLHKKARLFVIGKLLQASLTFKVLYYVGLQAHSQL